MNNLIGLTIAGALIAAAIFFTAPRYQVSSGATFITRIDTRTGDISICNEGDLVGAAVCSEWGARSLEEFRESRRVKSEMEQQVQTPTDQKISDEEFNKMMEDFKKSAEEKKRKQQVQ